MVARRSEGQGQEQDELADSYNSSKGLGMYDTSSTSAMTYARMKRQRNTPGTSTLHRAVGHAQHTQYRETDSVQFEESPTENAADAPHVGQT